METKWLMIAWAVIMVGISAGGAYESHTKSQCRQSFAQSTKTSAEIAEICK